MQTFKVLAPFSIAWHRTNMVILKSMLWRQQRVSFQWKRKKEGKKKSDTYMGSQYDKACFTTLSLYYPVYKYERVKFPSLFIKPFWLALLLSSLLWQGWQHVEKWTPFVYGWSAQVILEAYGHGGEADITIGCLVLHVGNTNLGVREKCFAWCIKKVLQDIACFTVGIPAREKFRVSCYLVEN